MGKKTSEELVLVVVVRPLATDYWKPMERRSPVDRPPARPPVSPAVCLERRRKGKIRHEDKRLETEVNSEK